ncbi:TonB-dependent receptor [Flavobacterium tegetincola]|uniref:TonB-dependent receptor n=1 Tax=Flavobacterium tegetincola TaxID=150172 RepID=UPI00040A6191|nr:TonB-dependent receptor [Flavobacterium tegetincola]
MRTLITFLLLTLTQILLGQTVISGNVMDEKKQPIQGANVFLDGTYDGTSSDVNGNFKFLTSVKGIQVLKITFLSYEAVEHKLTIENYQEQTFVLRESVNSLDAVIINAGMLQAGDKARVSVLKPLDIVTTAGSAGDIVSALQTLPGTQMVGESGRLFVRGGESDETQTFVDGLRVAQPYGASANNVPTRGRFSPFLFSGISFSTGGFSAEYGEALSSVLLLNTIDEPVQEQTDISLMTVGLGLSTTKKWNKSSLSINTAYIDLAPYQIAIPQAVDWNRPFQSLSGEAVYRYQFEQGLLKVYTAFDASRFDLNQENLNSQVKDRVDLNNNNLYFNAVYKGFLVNNWQLIAGASYGLGQNKIDLNQDDINNEEDALHLKMKVFSKLTNRFKVSFGADYFLTQFDESYSPFQQSRLTISYNSEIGAVYSEVDYFFSKKLAFNLGIRASNNAMLEVSSVSPRASVAYKTGKFNQFSFAYGNFEQAPRQDYLKFSNQFGTEKTQHFILNFTFAKEGTTLRAEVYYKKYKDLVKYDTETPIFSSDYSNSGFGYAKGLDVFWREDSRIKNLEYWISYSFIDTQRDYRNYLQEATPSFVAKHTASVVTKYWISTLRSQLGVTYNFNSGRPYENPNTEGFLNEKTKSFSNINLGWAYLLSPQKILYFSMSNVLGTKNVFGYEYSNTANQQGMFPSRAIIPTASRFVFVGFFWTISADKKTNQLDNL